MKLDLRGRGMLAALRVRLAIARRTFVDGPWYWMFFALWAAGFLFLTGCDALRAALPFLAPAVAAGTHGAAEIVAAKESAAKCEAGRKATDKKLDRVERDIREIRAFVAADATHVDAGAPVLPLAPAVLPMADAGTDASAP